MHGELAVQSSDQQGANEEQLWERNHAREADACISIGACMHCTNQIDQGWKREQSPGPFIFIGMSTAGAWCWMYQMSLSMTPKLSTSNRQIKHCLSQYISITNGAQCRTFPPHGIYSKQNLHTQFVLRKTNTCVCFPVYSNCIPTNGPSPVSALRTFPLATVTQRGEQRRPSPPASIRSIPSSCNRRRSVEGIGRINVRSSFGY